nr:coiled coil domain containing protein 162 [Hymenolepis microstoma]
MSIRCPGCTTWR